jgi:hypothetical protein
MRHHHTLTELTENTFPSRCNSADCVCERYKIIRRFPQQWNKVIPTQYQTSSLPIHHEKQSTILQTSSNQLLRISLKMARYANTDSYLTLMNKVHPSPANAINQSSKATKSVHQPHQPPASSSHHTSSMRTILSDIRSGLQVGASDIRRS